MKIASISGKTLYELEAAISIEACVEAALSAGANLRGADLLGANLLGARGIRLPTGETWEEYLTQTVPALCTAGGRALSDVATPEHWDCHEWGNCPMSAAFGVDSMERVPILHRPRVEQFIQFFDARQIPLAVVRGDRLFAEYQAETDS